jgi:hypothetical protein
VFKAVRRRWAGAFALLLTAIPNVVYSQQQTTKPNILVVFGDDVGYWNMIDHVFLLLPTQAIVGQFLMGFKEFPPRQRPASFSVDQPLEALRQQGGSGGRLKDPT